MKQGGRLNAEFDKLCVLILSYLKINIVFFILSTLYDCFFQRMVQTKLQNMMKTTVASEMTKMSLQMFTQDCLSKTKSWSNIWTIVFVQVPQITFQDTCKFDGEPRVFYKGPHFKISSFHPDRIRVLSPKKNMPVNLLLLYCIYCRTDKMSCSIILGLTHHAGPMTYSTNVLSC